MHLMNETAWPLSRSRWRILSCVSVCFIIQWSWCVSFKKYCSLHSHLCFRIEYNRIEKNMKNWYLWLCSEWHLWTVYVTCSNYGTHDHSMLLSAFSISQPPSPEPHFQFKRLSVPPWSAVEGPGPVPGNTHDILFTAHWPILVVFLIDLKRLKTPSCSSKTRQCDHIGIALSSELSKA